MKDSRLAALPAATAAMLAMLAMPAAPAARAAPAASAGAQAVTPEPAPASTVATTVPCPTPQPPVSRPARPPSPTADPLLRTVGGAGLATTGLIVPSDVGEPPAVTATSWLVADLDTGAVLGGCDPHQYGVPASVQKLLLVAAVLPKLDPKQVTTVTAADLDFEPGSSAAGLVLDGRYSVETLWLGLLLNSGNDTANVLARLGGGAAGLAGGMRAMNAEAARLGAYQTHAVTPSGLDGPGQFTSAYDLALIARACFGHEAFRRYVATKWADIDAQPAQKAPGFRIQNDNPLLFRYPGALGGKTGYTDLARHTYVGAAERGGRRLVVTLLGAEASPLSGWEQGAALLDWGFTLPRDAAVGRLVGPGEPKPATASPTPPMTAAAAPRPAEASGSAGLWSSGVGAGMALALAATPMLLLAAARHRRRSARRRTR